MRDREDSYRIYRKEMWAQKRWRAGLRDPKHWWRGGMKWRSILQRQPGTFKSAEDSLEVCNPAYCAPCDRSSNPGQSEPFLALRNLHQHTSSPGKDRKARLTFTRPINIAIDQRGDSREILPTIEKHAIAIPPITSCSTCFLVISVERLRHLASTLSDRIQSVKRSAWRLTE